MSDADPCLHNHPWPWAFSYILAGFYLEARGRSHLLRRDGDWLTLRTNTFHRIAEVSDGGAWTLFITSAGPRQPWGFLVPGQGFTPHAGRYYP